MWENPIHLPIQEYVSALLEELGIDIFKRGVVVVVCSGVCAERDFLDGDAAAELWVDGLADLLID